MKFRFAVLLIFCAIVLSVCKNEDNSPGEYSKSNYPDGREAIWWNVADPADSPFTGEGGAVQKVNYNNDGEDVVINLSGLNNHSVYLVKVNTGSTEVGAPDTGAVVSYSPSYSGAREDVHTAKSVGGAAVSGIFDGKNGQTITRYDPVGINEKIYEAIRSGKLRHEEPSNGANNSLLRSVNSINTSAQTYMVDYSTKKFYVQREDGTYDPNGVFATLRYQGTRCNIWVVDKNYSNSSRSDNDNQITSGQAKAMAEKFDDIYSKETAVFGYEYGGSPGDPAGGIDSDERIQILVYDIFDDYSRNQTGGVLGYFYSGDEFRQSELNKSGYGDIKSNEAEMFYIDAHFTDSTPKMIYSTLVHEFQHMIHYNQKAMRRRKESAAWFNEMLSMLAEDLIDPLIEISTDDDAHPVNARMPTFLRYYNYADPTVWLDGNYVLASYANSYALGAYLVRNFGGVDFVKELMTNDYVDITSINMALKTDANSTGIGSFTEALSRFGEALLFNMDSAERPPDVLSFNNTVTSKIGSTSYTFEGFDLYGLTDSRGKPFNGPLVWETDKTYALHPRTSMLQTNRAWQGRTGNLSITLRPPAADSDVDMYIIVR